jgi:isopenicillin N synthase-like dioxygenase
MHNLHFREIVMDVLRVDYESKNAAEKFSESLKNTGFAVIYNHPIEQHLIDDIYNEWFDFFKSPEKNNYQYNVETQDGFFPQSVSETAKGCELKDIKEYYHIYPWGQFPDFLSDKTHQLYKQLNQMAKVLLNWVEQFLPKNIADQLSMSLSKMIENTPLTLLRILHYPPLSGDEPLGAVRAAEHGDINLLTLLVGATQTGLQVKDSDGLWHDVPCDIDSIAVNIGDMLEICTQGYYRSTKHRVINPVKSNDSRLSMPLFLHPRQNVILTKDKTAGEFLKERLHELGVTN